MSIKDNVKTGNSYIDVPALCSALKYGNTANSGQFYIQPNSTVYNGWVICLPSITYADASAFKTAMTGQKIVYELATPITTTLTPQQISVLLGQNNLFADSGDVDIEYKADIQLWVEKKLSEL